MDIIFSKELSKLNSMIYHNFNRFCQEHPLEEKEKLSRSGMGIIVFLYEHTGEEIYQKDIEKEFLIRRSTASSVISNLEEKGYVQRVNVDGDKRLKKIVLTKKADTITDHVRDAQAYINNIITGDITDQEIYVFKNVLEKMMNNLKEER